MLENTSEKDLFEGFFFFLISQAPGEAKGSLSVYSFYNVLLMLLHLEQIQRITKYA